MVGIVEATKERCIKRRNITDGLFQLRRCTYISAHLSGRKDDGAAVSLTTAAHCESFVARMHRSCVVARMCTARRYCCKDAHQSSQPHGRKGEASPLSQNRRVGQSPGHLCQKVQGNRSVAEEQLEVCLNLGAAFCPTPNRSFWLRSL